jgi:carboxyl-terminal processing protease
VIASLNVVELLKRHHYSKPPLDDARSVIIYDSYIKLLDPSRSYFMASDIAEFDKWKTQFDDFLKSGDLNPGSPSTSATWTASKRVWTSPWPS